MTTLTIDQIANMIGTVIIILFFAWITIYTIVTNRRDAKVARSLEQRLDNLAEVDRKLQLRRGTVVENERRQR